MTEHPNITKIRRALQMEGGLYTWEDVLAAFETGDMQAFSDDESLVVTRISKFPQKSVLEITLAVGSVDQLQAIEPRLISFAANNNCSAIMAYGRLGWEGVMTEGWEKVMSLYIKDLSK